MFPILYIGVIWTTFNSCEKLLSVRHLLYKEACIGAITQVESFRNLIGISFTAVLLFGFKMFNCNIIFCSVIRAKNRDFDLLGSEVLFMPFGDIAEAILAPTLAKYSLNAQLMLKGIDCNLLLLSITVSGIEPNFLLLLCLFA